MALRPMKAVSMLAVVAGGMTHNAWGREEQLLTPTMLANSTNENGAPVDNMGTSIAIDGNMSVSGAPLNDISGANSGAAFVFRKNGSTWGQMQKLKAADGAAGDNFGTSVALSGNLIVVGAHFDDDLGTDSGSAYVFRYNPSTDLWVQERLPTGEPTKLRASDGTAGDAFGRSVGISGNTIIVGAYCDGDGGAYSGSAYVFTYNPSTQVWTQQQKLRASDAAASDFFGLSVGISGNTALVGAWADDDRGTSSGAAYVFKLTNNSWVQSQKLTPTDGAADDRFGRSVSISGNYALMGSHCDDDLGIDTGSAYIYSFNGSTWTQQQKLTASDAALRDGFGNSVSIKNDTAVIGASGVNSGWSADSGAAYVYQLSNGTWTETTKLRRQVPSDSDFFGCAVAASDATVAVGASGFDGALPPNGCGMNCGASFAIDLNPPVNNCPGDVDASGFVNSDDLVTVINAWGVCTGCPADINGNGNVNIDDLAILINGWGACP